MNPPRKPPTATDLVAIARAGAAKAARLVPDTPEFYQLADFIGSALEGGREAGLVSLAQTLREQDRSALAWYLHLLRTLCGTVPTNAAIRHLVLVPVFIDAPTTRPLSLGTAAHEIAGSLEHALDLGAGTFKLREQGCSLPQLEGLSPLRWRELARGESDLSHNETGFAGAGALIGLWTVPDTDKVRLSRKLSHVLQRTPALNTWKARTEALLEEGCGATVRVFPAMLLQDFFQGVRQLQLHRQLEVDRQNHPVAQALHWNFDERSGLLSWRLGLESSDSVISTLTFPDEPASLVQGQLKRLTQRLRLAPNPPLP